VSGQQRDFARDDPELGPADRARGCGFRRLRRLCGRSRRGRDVGLRAQVQVYALAGGVVEDADQRLFGGGQLAQYANDLRAVAGGDLPETRKGDEAR
jgi:hypothetical protein